LPRGDDDQQQHPLFPGGVDGGDNVSLIIACDDLDVVVMHTFMDVDGGVDMHPPFKHPPSFPSVFTTFPVYIHLRSTDVLRRC
jgi:hypothetical protein